MGRVDVLVNNAALGPTMAPTVDTSLKSFQRAIRVNLTGPFVMAREAASRMSRGGAIVNIASLAGVLGNPRRNAYAASKAGLISVTKSLACEWAARGIRVCADCAGLRSHPDGGVELERTGKVDLALVRQADPDGPAGASGRDRLGRQVSRLGGGALCHGRGFGGRRRLDVVQPAGRRASAGDGGSRNSEA